MTSLSPPRFRRRAGRLAAAAVALLAAVAAVVAPASAASDLGTVTGAFQAADGTLWLLDSTGVGTGTPTGLRMRSSSSSSSPSYRPAPVDALRRQPDAGDQHLRPAVRHVPGRHRPAVAGRRDRAGASTGQSMFPGTNPALIRNDFWNWQGFTIAWEAPNDELWVGFVGINGPTFPFPSHRFMRPGTSPSIALSIDFAVAYQSTAGELWVTDVHGVGHGTGLRVMALTSPAVAGPVLI